MPVFVQVNSACKAATNLQSALNIFGRCKSSGPNMNTVFKNKRLSGPRNQLEIWRMISTAKGSLAGKTMAGKSAGNKKISQTDMTSARNWRRIDHDCHKIPNSLLAQAATAPLRHPRRPQEVKKCQSYGSSGGCSVNSARCGMKENSTSEVECDVDKVKTTKEEVNEIKYAFSPVMKILQLLSSMPQCFHVVPLLIQDIFVATSLYVELSVPALVSKKSNGDTEFIPPVFHILPKIAQHEAAKQKSLMKQLPEEMQACIIKNPATKSKATKLTNQLTTLGTCESEAERKKSKNVTGCGGVKTESGERSINCSAIKNDKDNLATDSARTSASPMLFDCRSSSAEEKLTISQNSTGTCDSSTEFNCNKLKNVNNQPAAYPCETSKSTGLKEDAVPDSHYCGREDKNGEGKGSVVVCSSKSQLSQKISNKTASANENSKLVDCNTDSKDGKLASVDCTKYINSGKKDSKEDKSKLIDCSKYKRTSGNGNITNVDSTNKISESRNDTNRLKLFKSAGAVKLGENSLDRECPKDKGKLDCSIYTKFDTENSPLHQTENEKLNKLSDTKTSFCMTDTKIENDFCKAREPKSTVNHTSFPKSKDCQPITCPKVAEKKIPQKAVHEKSEPPKRIKIMEKPAIFNCCLKIAVPQKIAIENCPMPSISHDGKCGTQPKTNDASVIIKMHYVGLCGSDTLMYTEGTHKNEETNMILGREGAGVVIEVGNAVEHLKKGDGVVIESGVPCNQCKFCKSGRYNICTNTQLTGLLSTYVGHPARYCHKIPNTKNLREAALAHPLALALHACNLGRVSIGSRVLILGACPRGLSAIIAARAMGADKIAVIDTLDKNLKVASELCADNSILADTSMSSEQLSEMVLSEIKCRPNVVIDCCGCTKTVQMAILTVENGGRCVLSGCQTHCAQVPILPALMKEVCFLTSFGSANMFPRALSLISSSRANISKMITHEMEFCNAQDAFYCAASETESGAIKVMIKWPNSEPEKNA